MERITPPIDPAELTGSELFAHIETHGAVVNLGREGRHLQPLNELDGRLGAWHRRITITPYWGDDGNMFARISVQERLEA